ncbi:hypothetical protein M5K25_000642 [Dendrobium thyrsiflorum]|uniref:Uncharacterized protein n=1 Tax=Dendrobium thyrsiflorum TaxID=117978 RepID=A0ABD0VUT9_DENTH
MRRSPKRDGRSFMETEDRPSDAGRSGNWSRMGSSIVSRRFDDDDEVEKKSTDAICELELGLGGGGGYGGSEDVEAVKATAESGENDGAGGSDSNKEEEEEKKGAEVQKQQRSLHSSGVYKLNASATFGVHIEEDEDK